MSSNHKDEDDEDNHDVRHMNDTTMPPPKTMPKMPAATSSSATSSGAGPATNPRRKFGLRKGFGLQDWVVLTKRAKDLAQRKGAPLRTISKAELRQHDQLHDGWCSLKGKVYNIAPYLAYHPGGEAILKKVLGKDATLLFDKYHRWVNIEGLIGTLQLGYLDTTSTASEGSTMPAYLTETKQPDEFAIPAPVITKTKARDMNNVLTEPPERDEDKVDEEYTEPWDEPPPKA